MFKESICHVHIYDPFYISFRAMSLSLGHSKLLPRGRSTQGPTKTAWTTRCDHLLPRGDSAGRSRSRRHKARHKPGTTSATRDMGNIPVRNVSFMRFYLLCQQNTPYFYVVLYHKFCPVYICYCIS